MLISLLFGSLFVILSNINNTYKMKHSLKIGEVLENYKKLLFSEGFTYEESNDYMKLIFERATKKYGKMDFFNIDKDGADSIIVDINNEFNK